MSSNRVILVTGGAGYIGTSICKSLLDHGFKPIIIDTCEFKETESKIWGTLIKGNILDQNLLDKTFKEYKPSVVIHLASYMDVHESVINPEKYYNNNLQGSITLL